MSMHKCYINGKFKQTHYHNGTNMLCLRYKNNHIVYMMVVSASLRHAVQHMWRLVVDSWNAIP